MSGSVPATIATIVHDLGELHQRREHCLDLIQRCLTDIANIEYRTDVLLDRRATLTALNDAAAASMNPGRAPHA